MKTFVTALALFGSMASAATITVACDGISSVGTNPCSTIGGTYDVSSGFCCIDSTKEDAYSTECISVLGLAYRKVGDGCIA
ncbi:hypothetical protein LX32DRAFT_640494 [Colletotrichum zoysiae]|uniref:Extracellular membrane protein CFEM domain-containing protein n=1 Tax=Colletotrichum zoysiae TaxID=1216348 RepID=A0AAD9HGI4_9PEZI|nr:hypothetical protein LX32DRAFT_640494 [Colletotrichum zoysiae]